MRLALYQPDIPQNTGTILRMAACWGVPVDVIGPAGFDMRDKALRRAGLDYLAAAEVKLHQSFRAFQESRQPGRLVLMTTRGDCRHCDFRFEATDTLMVGRESAGVPDDVHGLASARLVIPMKPPMRSLNIAVAAAVALGEALRQTGGFPSSGGPAYGAEEPDR